MATPTTCPSLRQDAYHTRCAGRSASYRLASAPDARTALHPTPTIALRRRTNREPAHLVEQRAQADPQQARRLAAVAARRLERAENRLTLHGLHLALKIE